MSESQERMMAIVEPAHVERFLEICRRWEVDASAIGSVTDTDRLVVQWHGDTVVDVPPRSVAHEGPVYERPAVRPSGHDALQADGADRLPRPTSGEALRETLLALAGSSNLCDKSWVTDQYDRYVQGNTVLAQPEDAGVIRVDEETGRGVALATDGNGRFCRLDPYTGAQAALAESYRNVAATGARPIAVTDCLNFGSPEDPAVMWQFAQVTRGLAAGCRALGIPVTGGNVSFYNSTGDAAILPTPIVGVLGVFDDVRRRTPMGFPAPGLTIYLLGETRDELSGSEWAHTVHSHLGGVPPRVDLDAELRLAEVLVTASVDRLLAAAHDLSDGGLGQALVESCLRHGVGASITLPPEPAPFVALFSESTARALVAVTPGRASQLLDRCARSGVPVAAIGETSGTAEQAALEVHDVFSVPLSELRAAWSVTLPTALGH